MDKPRSIWNVSLNSNTRNFGGLQWIIDGEDGRRNYPGCWAECQARAWYKRGLNYDSPVPEDIHTYTAQIGNKYYACAMDFFATTIFPLDTDAKPVLFKTIAERNEAIQRICKPYNSYLAAHIVANRYGLYSGELYEN